MKQNNGSVSQVSSEAVDDGLCYVIFLKLLGDLISSTIDGYIDMYFSIYVCEYMWYDAVHEVSQYIFVGSGMGVGGLCIVHLTVVGLKK